MGYADSLAVERRRASPHAPLRIAEPHGQTTTLAPLLCGPFEGMCHACACVGLCAPWYMYVMCVYVCASLSPSHIM